MSQAPNWATQFGLIRKGNYYEGFVDDISLVLETHKRQTVTSWGTRRSTFNKDKENASPENVILHCIDCKFTSSIYVDRTVTIVLDIAQWPPCFIQ